MESKTDVSVSRSPHVAQAASTSQQGEDKWSTMKRGKDKGKMQTSGKPPDNPFCDNGFDALEILNDLLELQNPG